MEDAQTTPPSLGWVKLHRKLLDNRILKYDHSAMLVFVTLLLLVRHKDGTYDTGRFRLAEIVGMKPSTVYKILKRLEKAEMVTLDSNSRYTIISISKWKDYQGNGNSASNNSVTSQGQPSNTKQERRKKKEDTLTKVKVATPEIVKPVDKISKLYYEAIKALALPVKNHNNVKSTIAKMSREDTPERIEQYLIFMRDRYATIVFEFKPEISEALDLHSKRVAIMNGIKRERTKQNKNRTVEI